MKRAAAIVAVAQMASPALAGPLTIIAVQLTHFAGANVGEQTQGLIFRGGLELHSATDTFGGRSGVGFIGTDNHLVMVSDRGNFVSGQLIYDDNGAPLSVIG